ncbi:MAG: TlpA disulfide reductase family protein [Crocinitomicaceae bacterium]
MTSSKKEKSTFQKWSGYLLNAALILVILTFFIPSWRMAFQSWYQGLTLSEVSFENTIQQEISDQDATWELFDLDGNMFNFAEFKGRPIVINFWATWCSYCRVELAELKELKSQVNTEVVFIAITEETPQMIENSGLDKDYSFLYTTQNFPSFAQVSAYPTLLVIDSEMNIIHRQEGAGAINTEKNISFLNDLLLK